MNKHRFGEAFDNVSREPPIVRDIILQLWAEKQWRYKIKCYWHKYPQLFSLFLATWWWATAELTRANDSNNFCIFKNSFHFISTRRPTLGMHHKHAAAVEKFIFPSPIFPRLFLALSEPSICIALQSIVVGRFAWDSHVLLHVSFA